MKIGAHTKSDWTNEYNGIQTTNMQFDEPARCFMKKKEFMMRIDCGKYRIAIIVFVLFLVFPLVASTAVAAPVLNFSDIVSGPATGNTDGVGSGAIVTIWGQNLGSTQSTSTVYVGSVQATAIYYWQNANATLPGGPSDLYTYHKMQEIAFAVPATAVNGANTISVKVGGVTSNTLPFTVQSGNIRFVKSGGSNSTSSGSWSAPFATLQGAMTGGGIVVPGDIIYSVGVGSTSVVSVGHTASMQPNSSSTNPIALVTYPNTTALIAVTPGGGDGLDAAVECWYPSNRNNQYITLSKLTITCDGSQGNCNTDTGIGISPFQGWRAVGCAITGPTVYSGSEGAVGASGAGSNIIGPSWWLGLYIHNYGVVVSGWHWNDDTSTWTANPCSVTVPSGETSINAYQHLFYVSLRSNTLPNQPGYEIGWCNLINNPIMHGIHLYDIGGYTTTFTTPLLIHNNFIWNQGGHAIDISLPYACTVMLYNNIVGVDSSNIYAGQVIGAYGGSSTNYFYNNTFYGYNVSSLNDGNIMSSGTNYFINDILVDTKGNPYFETSDTPNTQNNDVFYSTYSSPPSLPGWYSTGDSGKNANPLFNNAGSYDFSLQSGSPALAAGANLTATYPLDFYGNTRPVPQSIGAAELTGGGTSLTAPGVPYIPNPQ